MGDHFVLLVDRLLTESTLEAAIESSKQLLQAATSIEDDLELEKSSKALDFGDISTPRKLVECRICQDEDLDSYMETPCSCSGSLKYAHRRCVQRWCNEKGNTLCEICQQQFKPNYTAPPPLFQIGRIPLNFRGNWEVSRRDLTGARVVPVVSTGRSFINASYDEQSSSTTRNVVSCRLVAVVVSLMLSLPNLPTKISMLLLCWFELCEVLISRSWLGQFMVLLILRHILPLVLNGSKDISFPLLLLVLLRTAGVIIPVCFMAMTVTAFQNRRHRRDLQNAPLAFSDEEEAESLPAPAEQHVINVD